METTTFTPLSLYASWPVKRTLAALCGERLESWSSDAHSAPFLIITKSVSEQQTSRFNKTFTFAFNSKFALSIPLKYL